MSAAWDTTLTQWLPEPLATHIAAEEETRFARLVDSVCTASEAITDPQFALDNVQLGQETVSWIAHVETFTKTRTQYDVGLVERLYRAIMHLVFTLHHDVLTQSRWVNCATALLRAYSADLAAAGVVVDWRPYWDLFQRFTEHNRNAHYDCSVKMVGYLYVHAHCKKARRLFGSECAGDMWDLLTPDLARPLTPEAPEAIIMFSTFFPHHAVGRAPQAWPWNDWAMRMLDLWDGIQHNAVWDGLWMAVFSRFAKHDTHSVMDWEVVNRRICGRAAWLFKVPVGGQSSGAARTPSVRAPLVNVLGQTLNRSATCQGHLAKILVYTLRPGNAMEAQSEAGLTATAALQGLSSLLEHYFHSSNYGAWSRELSAFLDALSWNLVRRRLPREANPDWVGDRARVALDPLAISPFLAVMRSLAEPAIYHKSASLQAAALETLSNVVYLEPKLVLPLIWQRFTESLEASDSVHQLPASFRLLSCCVRPMLLTGLEAAEGDGMDSDTDPRERAALELGRAMMLLLPALDANDQKKTQAAIGFYLSVFSNCVSVRGLDTPADEGKSGVPLGLYLEDFVLQFLDKVFSLIDALDTGAAGFDTAAVNENTRHLMVPSWLGSYYKFTALVQQMFAKCPPSVVRLAARQVAKYAMSVHVPQKAADLFYLIAHGCGSAPAVIVDQLLVPLMQQVTEDATSMDGKNPSSASVTALLAAVNVVHGAACGLSTVPESLLPTHARALIAMAHAASRVRAPGVAEMTGVIMERVLLSLASTCVNSGVYASQPGPSIAVPGSLNESVAAWVPTTGENSRKLAWHVPSAQETSLARELAEAILQQCRAEVKAMIADGSISDSHRPSRLRLRTVQCQLSAITAGLEDMLPLLDLNPGATPDSPAALAPTSISICDVPTPGWADCTLFQDATRLALLIAAHTDPANTWSLKAAVRQLKRLSGTVRAANSQEHTGNSIRSRDRSYTEPQVGGLLLGQGLSASPQQPHWAVELRVEQHLAMRITLLSYNWWGTQQRPKLPLAEMHPLLLESVAALQQLSLHRYKDVRGAAGGALVHNYLSWSPDLASAAIPGFVSAMALLTNDAACGLPPSALDPATPYTLPPSLDAARAITAAQQTRMRAVIAASGANDASAAAHATAAASVAAAATAAAAAVASAATSAVARVSAAAGAAAAGDGAAPAGDGKSGSEGGSGARDGVCTEDNKHVVQGAYDVVGTALQLVVRMGSVDSDVMASVFLAMLVMQRYALAEVQGKTNQMIAAIGTRLHRGPALVALRPDAALTSVAAFLLDKLEAGALHWRAAGMAHVLFIHLAPLNNDAALAARVAAVQLQQFAHEDILLLKDLAALGLQQALKLAFQVGTAPAYRTAVVSAVRAALRDPAWASQLMPSLNALHSVSAQERSRMWANLEATPESKIFNFMRLAAQTECRREGVLNLTDAPTPPPTQGEGAAAGAGVQRHLSQLVECLGRAAPVPLMAAMRTQLLAWLDLPIDEDRLEPQMEYVAMELCIGAVVSGAAFVEAPRDASSAEPSTSGGGGGAASMDAGGSAAADAQSAWDAWFSEFLVKRFATVSLAKAPLWCLAHANALRSLAQAGTSLATELDPEFATPCPEALTTRYTTFLCSLSTSMTGRATADYKYVATLLFALDMLIQVQSTAPSVALSHSLTALIDASLPVIATAAKHPLAAVRCTSCYLAAVALAALRAPGPLVPAAAADAAQPSSSAARLEALVAGVLSDAVAALTESNADASAVQPDAAAAAAADGAAPLLLGSAEGAAPMDAIASLLAGNGNTPPATPPAPRSVAGGNGNGNGPTPAPPLTAQLQLAALASVARAGAAPASQPAAPGADSDSEAAAAASDAAAASELAKCVHAWEAAIDWQSAFVAGIATSVYTPMFRDQLVRAFPWVLDAQGLQHPGLQPIVLPVRKALMWVKVVVFDGASVAKLTEVLLAACSAPLWQSRGSALHAFQSFWFRNYFLMTSAQRLSIAGALRSALLDSKLECRQAAAATLSGLIKCLPAPESSSLRAAALADAERLFPRGRRARGAKAAAQGAEHHACVLELRALLLSSPYEILPWMDDVLMALVRASRLPNPVKKEATTAIGDFRKTHEHADIRPLRERLTPDVWEAVRDVSSSSSYFV